MARVHDLPLWFVGIATIALFVALSILGLFCTRRWSRRRALHAMVDNSVIGWIFSGILGIYAIAIGLIAVASWSNAAEATAIASREAAEIAALHRDLRGYPEAVRGDLGARLTSYTRYVIEEAWPQQRRGEVPHGGTASLNDFERVLYSFEPTTEAQKAVHAEALRAFNTLIELRRQRLEAVNYAVPGTLWSVVLFGAMLSIVASFVFSMESFRVHALMTGMLAAIIGLLVFFILITDLPYRGAAGVGPDSYELVLHDLLEPASAR
jgi:uncharacterized protein DUF4239